MSGRALPVIGSMNSMPPWTSGRVTAGAACVLAPNPSPWTLDGTNTWVLGHEDEAVAVVDPGPDDPAHREAICEAVDGRRVTAIVLTHGHLDHSEGARALAEVLRAPVRAVDPHLRLGSEGLAPGDVIDVAGGCEVMLTPGHTSDSACLVLHEDHTVIAGDTILGRGTALVAWPDGRLGDYLDSLHRLRDALGETAWLLPGHGPALDRPAEVIDAYLAHRQARLAHVRAVLARGVSDPPSVVEIVYAEVPRELWPAAELTVRAQLEYLGRLAE